MQRIQSGTDFSTPHFVHEHTGPGEARTCTCRPAPSVAHCLCPLPAGIWTKVLRSLLQLPDHFSARNMLDTVYTNASAFRQAAELGVCIVHQPFFNSLNVQNEVNAFC